MYNLIPSTLNNVQNAFCGSQGCSVLNKINVPSFSAKSDSESDLSKIEKPNLTLQEILRYGSSVEYHSLAGEVIKFLELKHPKVIDGLVKKLATMNKSDVKIEVENFIKGLNAYDPEFKQWVAGQLNTSDATSDANGKQDVIDQIMNSSCITELGIKPECQDKLKELIEALKKCNEGSSKPEEGEKPEIVTEPEEGEKPDDVKEPDNLVKQENIPDILEDFKNTICSDQGCDTKVGVHQVSPLKFSEMQNQNGASKATGKFIISNNGTENKIYLQLDDDTIIIPEGSYCIDSVLPMDHNETYCSKASKVAKVMQFLEKNHHDYLDNFFDNLANRGEGSDCKDTIGQFMEGLQSYNQEFSEWLLG